MTLSVITLDENGGRWARRIREGYPDAEELRAGRDGPLSGLFGRAFAQSRGLVCVMASGIVVRMVIPLAKSKLTDPAVVVLDDEARWAISLLSGHEGGANALAYRVAALTGAEPVVTTGTDTKRRALVGVGCRRGVEADEIKEAVRLALAEAGLSPADVRRGASVRLKRGEEGLLRAFDELDIPLLFIEEARINEYDGPYERSAAAERNIGARAVAEPCALLAGRRARLVVPKRVVGRVTVAVALED